MYLETLLLSLHLRNDLLRWVELTEHKLFFTSNDRGEIYETGQKGKCQTVMVAFNELRIIFKLKTSLPFHTTSWISVEFEGGLLARCNLVNWRCNYRKKIYKTFTRHLRKSRNCNFKIILNFVTKHKTAGRISPHCVPWFLT